MRNMNSLRRCLLGMLAVATVVLGVLPNAVLRFGDLSILTGAVGP